MKNKHSFNDIKWENATRGVKQKIIQAQDKQMRLVRFEDDFVEEDWCTSGHIGLVLDGEMKIDLDGKTIAYKKGDALIIAESCKHKANIEKGKFAELILFEG